MDHAQRPKIDRIACPWLIDRCVDQAPAFLYVLKTDVLDMASAGLYAISLGLSNRFKDDFEMLEHGLAMYDALFAWCKECPDEGRKIAGSGCSNRRRIDATVGAAGHLVLTASREGIKDGISKPAES